MFVDKVRITVIGGRGGDGAVAFHREKYVASGGPDGGDGGHGGSVILHVNDNLSTLLDFRYKRKYAAQAGANGLGRRMSGKRGEPLVIDVPRGTVVRDAETNQIIVDMSTGEDFVIAKGGRGGWGNAHYATATRQVPRFAKAGLKGQERDVILELKLLADVGLVGFPNVGKSTLLSVTSNARPKIANYHFTTLFPNLGVIYVDEGVSFVMADIPGIIEGAAEGAGLGHDFLRHIDRCRLLWHLVDISCFEGRDPVDEVEMINAELDKYSPELAARPQLLVANKADALDRETVDIPAFEHFAEVNGWELFYISAVTGEGVDALLKRTAELLETLPPMKVYEREYAPEDAYVGGGKETVIRRENDTFFVEGEWLLNLMGQINFDDYESLNFFQRVLQRSGVFEALEEKGCRDGHTVSIYGFEFEYVK